MCMGDAYVGMVDKVPARVIVHRLTKQQQLTGILCVGKSKFYLKRGSHPFKFIIVKR
uniref:Transposase for insertion sequence element IS231C n=1 Tax=Bacillus cereus HuA4-10 TaxID=1053206 RepID=J8DRJ2_BACCE|nr:transposase for insertion sequence element IS231C [Bacillus cereus HuA4-10]